MLVAKERKSGLGRGIDSLLGDSYSPQGVPVRKPAASPTRSSYQEDEKETTEPKVLRTKVSIEPGEIPDYDPILEPRHDQDIELTPVIEREVVVPVVEEEIQEIHLPVGDEIVAIDEVPIDKVVPNPDQPRTYFKKEEIEELAESIKADGLLQPILVRAMEDDTYQIIAGERRWQACKQAGCEVIPVRVKNADENRALELALIENIQRSDLNPIEEAYGYRRLMERNNMTQAEVAQAMSKGRSTVANALRLLELPEEAQQLLFEEKITAGHARAILSIPDEEGRKKLTQKLKEEKLSVREAEAIARLLSGKKSGEATPTRQPLPPMYKKVAKVLRDTLGTGVRIKSSKGKNKIEIEFKDEEDLQRLFEEIIPID